MPKTKKNTRTMLAIALTALFSAALFFAIGYSSLEGLTKGILMLSVLVLSGMLLEKLSGLEGWYGVLMLRGKKGLGFMQALADRDPKFWREFCDFGLTLGFGLPYGWLLFSKTPRKFAKHAGIIAILAFLAFFYPLVAQSGRGLGVPAAATFAALASAGLLAAGGLFLAGFAGLLSNTINILAVPNAPAGVMLVIPGLTVPWHWIVALIIAAGVHEISHGILARAEGLEVKNSGGILLGFLPIGAFVEPDEEKFKKLAIMKKQRILVAGTTANFATALVFALLLALAATAPIQGALSGGISISSVSNTSLAAQTLHPGDILVSMDGKPVSNAAQFGQILLSQNGSENVSIKTAEMAKEQTFAATELVIAAVANTTPAQNCNGLSKLNPFNGCFFAYSIACSKAQIACPPQAPQPPASNVLAAGDALLAIDGKPVSTVEQMRAGLSAKSPGQKVTLLTGRGEKTLYLDANGKLGIVAAEKPAITFEEKPKAGLEGAYYAYALLSAILLSTMQLNLALAVINLLPLFITDGSRIIYEELMFRLKEPYEGKGKKTLSAKIAVLAGMVTVALLLINLIVPNL